MSFDRVQNQSHNWFILKQTARLEGSGKRIGYLLRTKLFMRTENNQVIEKTINGSNNSNPI